MLEFIISNYVIFIVAAIILLLGLFGYMMDKKKYKQYREEIVNEERAQETLEYQPDIQNVATPVLLDNESAGVIDNEQTSTTRVAESKPEVPVVPEVQQN